MSGILTLEPKELTAVLLGNEFHRPGPFPLTDHQRGQTCPSMPCKSKQSGAGSCGAFEPWNRHPESLVSLTTGYSASADMGHGSGHSELHFCSTVCFHSIKLG